MVKFISGYNQPKKANTNASGCRDIVCKINSDKRNINSAKERTNKTREQLVLQESSEFTFGKALTLERTVKFKKV